MKFLLWIKAVFAAGLLFSIALPAPVRASDDAKPAVEQVDPQKLEAAQAFLTASDFENQISEMKPPMMRQMMTLIVGQLEAKVQNAEERERLRQFSTHLSDAIANRFIEKRKEMMDLMAVAYARALTIEELQALTDFQQSPAGRKFNAALPELMNDAFPRIMKIMMGGDVQIADPIEPEKRRAVEEMMEASRFDQTIDLMLEQMAQQNAASQMPPGTPPEAVQEADAASKAMIEQFKSRQNEIKMLVVSIWGKRLDIEDVRAVTAFYETPIGKQTLDAMPRLFAEQQKMQQQMLNLMFADIGQIVQETLEKQGLQP